MGSYPRPPNPKQVWKGGGGGGSNLLPPNPKPQTCLRFGTVETSSPKLETSLGVGFALHHPPFQLEKMKKKFKRYEKTKIPTKTKTVKISKKKKNVQK